MPKKRRPAAGIPPEQLYRACAPDALGFETTRELEANPTVVGQQRALEALAFGARIDRPGYNLFALGPPGTGKHTTILAALRARAAEQPPAQDWVYVHNFATPHKPRAICLPPGRAVELRDAMNRLIDELRAAIPAAFESQDYQNRREAIEEEFRERQEQASEALREKAEAQGIAVIRTPTGFGMTPVRDGKLLGPEEFEKLPEEEREKVKAQIEQLQGELEALIRLGPRWDKERRERLRELNQQVTEFTVGHPIEELQGRFAALPTVCEYLEAVRADLMDNVHGLIEAERRGGKPDGFRQGDGAGFGRYRVNVLVGEPDADGAPVVYEDHPTLANLVGRVEHVPQMGTLVTDFTMIKPGALHRANGGCLLIDARSLLVQPYAWEALKRALRSDRICIESLASMLDLVSTVTLEPEPIPLRIKVVLVGERLLYYLLGVYDPDFPEMFKVAADFEDSMPRGDGGEAAFARMLATIVDREQLLAFDRQAIARVIEQGARLAGDAEKISLRLRVIADLMRETDFRAREAGAETVAREHVNAAIAARERRLDRLRERALESTLHGTLLVDTDGAAVGRVNGLTVIDLADFAFGRPVRITARVRLGAGKVVDIEREVELGGPLHSKGVLILSGFLSGHFLPEQPLSLSASLVFEQSYGGVEGDSASSAELYALLSALADVPIRQWLAVTGSVNQYGDVQAVGGVNEKIEGFFDLCRARGLTGTQGVLIPRANMRHLMLREDVVEACARGEFHVYPVADIAAGIECLTGVPAGTRDAQGRFPEDSVFGRAEARLRAYARARREFGGGHGEPAAGGADGAKP
jgi:lon-related putative ATP-dependent protease